MLSWALWSPDAAQPCALHERTFTWSPACAIKPVRTGPWLGTPEVLCQPAATAGPQLCLLSHSELSNQSPTAFAGSEKLCGQDFSVYLHPLLSPQQLIASGLPVLIAQHPQGAAGDAAGDSVCVTNVSGFLLPNGLFHNMAGRTSCRLSLQRCVAPCVLSVVA